MGKRLFDLIFAAFLLTVLSPLILLAAAAVALSSPGPVLYKANRIGVKCEPFTMHKLRTMHVDQGGNAPVITAVNDPRVFRLGSILRRLKIDELPQLYDILRGKMSFVGPRPEDPKIVNRYYSDISLETFDVLPGLTSPASVFHYTHGDIFLAGDDVEDAYVKRLLPVTIALELVYVRNASVFYDWRIIARTIRVLAAKALGVKEFAEPPELPAARLIVSESRLIR